VLLYLGRLHPKKNLANLIRAWKATPNSQPSTLNSWVLAIAGWDQGGYEAALRQLTADLGLLTSVIFLGPKFGADKDACYQACDAFVLPSLSEGQPFVVLEAWSHARPVLMTPECNLPDGFQKPAAIRMNTTVEGVAEGLEMLFAMDEAALREMGRRGRDLVIANFSWSQSAAQMFAVYNWMLGRSAAPDCVLFD
jgi:poly(glycerol-phosphate) alpha-glucosyltransferase